MDGEGSERGWKERGVGNIKLNVTKEEPKKSERAVELWEQVAQVQSDEL